MANGWPREHICRGEGHISALCFTSGFILVPGPKHELRGEYTETSPSSKPDALQGAIGLLSDARIVKDYTSKIIETLALSAESGHLIRKFVRTCKPALREQSDLERYLIATAEFSMVEAWQYQKTFPEDQTVRRKLIQRLLVWAFTRAYTQLLLLITLNLLL